MTTNKVALKSYRNERKYPFCPGCGHGMILDKLNEALTKLQLDPRKTVIVSDIGCVGLSDQYFATNAFHGLHGRSVTYATGIKLANPELNVIVLMGDGGVGIGGHHVLNAARRNIGITVLVFNNMNFGMTGGEHSVTTPNGAHTATTPQGNPEQPLDIAATVTDNGASYVWRGSAFDKTLPDHIVDAIQTDGFALLDIWELCTAYFVPNNDFNKRLLEEMLSQTESGSGVLHRAERPEYAQTLHELASKQAGKPVLPHKPLPRKFEAPVKRKMHVVVAGAAGGKVRSATRLIGVAGVMSGLWATQRDDYPTTVKSGHSVSEVILSPEEIRFTGIEKPDVLILLAPEAVRKVAHYLPHMSADAWFFTTPEFAHLETPARKVIIDAKAAGVRWPKLSAGFMSIVAMLLHTGLLSMEAFVEAVRTTQRPTIAEKNLATLPDVEKLVALLPKDNA